MLIIYYLCLRKPIGLLIAYLLQAITYCILLKKLGDKALIGLLPTAAEYRLSRKVFKKRRTFFYPLVLTVILLGFSFYVNPYEGVGIFYVICAFLIWGIFLAVLYGRLCRAFGKKFFYRLGSVILPPLFLTLLGTGKAEYTAPVFKPAKRHGRFIVIMGSILRVIVSACLLIAIIAGCGFLAIKQHMPAILVHALMEDAETSFADVGATGETVTRADVLGADLDAALETNQTRDYYFPDHSDDQDVTVFMYIIGADLEDQNGLASDNITQIIAATKQGSGLKFIIQAGGSKRWFTSGIKNASYGRYEIANGKLTQLETLPDDTDMADSQSLTDFLTWAGENNDSDRSMLVLWDHGGGIACGYGQDEINGASGESILVSDLADSLEKSGMKFDFIGFDACLMQDIEAAAALTPYADYYIASEETEAGLGWFYTVPFGALAQDPGMSDEAFADLLISCYDPYTKATTSDNTWLTSSLSVVDLSMVGSAYDQLSDFMASAAEEMADDPACFADLSLAASGAYSFYQDVQIDLLDFLSRYEAIDLTRTVASEEELRSLTEAIQASILVRNGASVTGINGIAFACPYHAITYYDRTSESLASLSCSSEKKALDTMFSIMAAQQMKQNENSDAAAGSLLSMIASISGGGDYTTKDWYIAGFEDYDNVTEFTEIPLTETADGSGCSVELPDETWEIITDVQTMVYQEVNDKELGTVWRYIGSDYLGDADENGHTLITPDDSWPTIGGQLVCYEADEVQTDQYGNLIYSGRIKARLNGSEDVYLFVQWNEEVEGQAMTAKILGYETVEDTETSGVQGKGYSQLTSGDSVQFLFDYYDENDGFIKTDTAGKKVRITNLDKFIVKDAPMDPCTLEFGGILKDVYGRILTTETLEVEITK